MSSYSRTKYRSVEIAVGPAYWPALGWTALLVLAQTTVVPLFVFRNAVPSLVTIAVVLYAVRAGARRGALLAIPAGHRWRATWPAGPCCAARAIPRATASSICTAHSGAPH